MDRRSGYFPMSRRQFGKLAGASAAGASLNLLPGFARLALAAEDASQIIKGKNPGMIIHNAQLGVMETPLPLLRPHALTPKSVLFNRLHFPHQGEAAWYATTDAPGRPDWTLEIDGLVQRPRQVKLADLLRMDRVKRVAVMQCAGNGRSYYAARQKVAGGQWKNGGMGNVEWEGVPLRHFLSEMKVLPAASVSWLTAEGWDQPPTPEGSDFSKSYELADTALDNALLAVMMNGEPIPAVHGGPLRLIIPGFYGNMNVKFLTKLLLMNEQSPSAYQSVGYRYPNSPVTPETFKANDYTHANSRPTYGQQIKSVIFSPLPEDKPGAGVVTVTGVALNDGQASITSVQVSADGGRSWKAADLKPAASPWAWTHWSASVTLAKGENALMCSATDALGRTQPTDGLARWNPRGYEWNGLDRVVVSA
ncbi:MAG TPA: sulfite oxidase [Burkholderiales bacterium]|nr:sulfite oxidase [Burkholderiales bacterium]